MEERKESVLEMLRRTRPRYLYKPPEPKPWHPQDERIATEQRQLRLRRQREQYEVRRPIIVPPGYREVEDAPGAVAYISERTGRRYTAQDVRRGALDLPVAPEDFPTAKVVVRRRGIRDIIAVLMHAIRRAFKVRVE